MVVSCQLHTLAALFPAKSLRYPFNRRLDGPQGRSGRCGQGKNSQPLLTLEPLIIDPVAQRYTYAAKTDVQLSLINGKLLTRKRKTINRKCSA